MNTIAIERFAARPAAGRNIFMALAAMVWVGVLSGFGTDSVRHVLKYGLDYPLIVHFHAVAFVGFLVLFTLQVALIRNGRADLHRRLGVAGAALAGVMVVLGPATAIIVDASRYVAKGTTPEFLAVQLTDIVAFGTLAGAGLLLRGAPLAHKRLMMLALIYISDAGFARLLNGIASAPLGDGFWGDMVGLYLGSDLLMLTLGAYDLVTRRRLHPAYVVGAVWMITLQLTAQAGLHSLSWKTFSLRLIGH
ncbi:MAG TPA: hypothetical protein VGJ20_04730 [Xanthobacteraceae bacterium]|jgi:hypothetical protein